MGPRLVVTIGTSLALGSFILLVLGQGSMVVVVAGTLVLDLAVQTSQVANQTQVYALDRAARSRLNTIFMAAMLLSGSIGAGLGGLAFATWGWTGTCPFGTPLIASGTAPVASSAVLIRAAGCSRG